MKRKPRVVVGALLFAAAPLFAQSPKPITVAWCNSEEAEAISKIADVLDLRR